MTRPLQPARPQVAHRSWADLLPRAAMVVLAWPLLMTALLVGPAWLIIVIWVPVILLSAREFHSLAAIGWPAWSRPGRALMVLAGGVLLPGMFPLLRVTRGAESALLAVLASWGGDCGAYLAGRAVGRHLISPRLSPRKTWEGAVASLMTALVLAEIFRAVGLLHQSGVDLWGRAAAANILAQTGDLVESGLKRRAGARHSGRLFPGGGGMLDSVDGLSIASGVLILFP